MKVRAIRSFIDKYSMKSIPHKFEFEVTKERFGELTGPRGIFVEKIEDEPPKEPTIDEELPIDKALIEPPKEEEPPEVVPTKLETLDFEKLTKKELVEYAKEQNIELNMEINKTKMIEILLKK